MPGAAALADGATATTALGAATALGVALATAALDVFEGSRIAFDFDYPQASGRASNATNRASFCFIDPDERARRWPRLRTAEPRSGAHFEPAFSFFFAFFSLMLSLGLLFVLGFCWPLAMVSSFVGWSEQSDCRGKN